MSRSVVSDQKKGRVAESGGGDAARASSHSITPDWLSRQLRQFRALLSAVSQRRLCTRERRIERGVCVSAESCPSASPLPLPPSSPSPRQEGFSRSLSPFVAALPFARSHVSRRDASSLLLILFRAPSLYFNRLLEPSPSPSPAPTHRGRATPDFSLSGVCVCVTCVYNPYSTTHQPHSSSSDRQV